jgi:hypothetical protein
MPLRHATHRLQRALITGVLFAFVLAQALGLMHRIVHAPFGGHGFVHASAEAPRADVPWVKALFAGHDNEHGCDLYDQSSHADLACGDVLTVALQEPAAGTEQLHSGWQLAAQAAGFLARGPPALV